ncbi:MAG: cytochrome c3 family protein [Clostridia bacterium]|nr:cytochrome c3 family protein [Clostridia bacterium]
MKWRMLVLFTLIIGFTLFFIYWYMEQARVLEIQKMSGSDRQICGICHTEENLGFNRKNLHFPFRNWQCTSCHINHNTSKRGQYVIELDKLCQSCHPSEKLMRSSQFLHQPVSKGRCMDCHDPHGSDFDKLLIVANDKLCRTCHVMGRLLLFPNLHKPFEEGFCLDCHVPHGSKTRGLLALSQKELCFSCHFSQVGDLFKRYTHKPFIEGDCTGCHVPHGSPYKPLLKNESIALCADCHSDINERIQAGLSHPVGTNISDPWRGDYLRCASCHQPHGTENIHLLRLVKDGLCLECHPFDTYIVHY